MERIERNILSGIYHPGDRLPAVRELASEAAVNPNTMQKALQELERSGLIYAERTNGRFITDDITMIDKMRDSLSKEETKRYFYAMEKLGLTPEHIREFMNSYQEEEQS
jgi:DNA-binding transcriptional regulator YhcF (GntR family)